MNLDQFKATYFQECEELLQVMEENLMAIQEGNHEADVLHAVFRAVHSIKGGAGAFGFAQLVGFAHTLETVLDHLRDGRLSPEPGVVTVLLSAGDILTDLVRAAQSDIEMPPDHGESVRGELDALTRGGPADADEEVQLDFEGIDFTPVAVDEGDEGGAGDESAAQLDFDGIDFEPIPVDLAELTGDGWRLRFAPRDELLRNANEPLLLIRELGRLGPLDVTADTGRIPDLSDVDPARAYLAWTMVLRAPVARDAVEEVFEFVQDDCDLEIEPWRNDEGGGDDDDGGGGGGIEPPSPTPAPEAQPKTPKGGAAPVAAPPARAEPREPGPGAREAKPAAGPEASQVSPSIRVDLDKVDRLVNMVGELVITQAMLKALVDQLPPEYATRVTREIEELAHHTRDLQDSVMAVRAQPVKTVFQRVPRLVRQLAAETGKQVRLVTAGENTEIDKTVIEQLGDPLTHMIRNAIDHGIESPDQRIAAGKQPEGTICLSAEHRGGRIVIRIDDDGRGINRERVVEKAIEKGLVAPGASLSDEEIDNLIFAPGFSTASTVSAISGRGVGMDVVKRNIQQLGGRVFINSKPGEGTTFMLTLPLTLAVLDGMIVSVGRETYVLPLANVIESLRPNEADIYRVVSGGEILLLRGEYVPLVPLYKLFHVRGGVDEPSGGVVVVVETEDSGKVGLLVDGLVGQQQVVIKSLEPNYDPVPGIAAATILGNGQVALILDVSSLREMSVARARAARPAITAGALEFAS